MIQLTTLTKMKSILMNALDWRALSEFKQRYIVAPPGECKYSKVVFV